MATVLKRVGMKVLSSLTRTFKKSIGGGFLQATSSIKTGMLISKSTTNGRWMRCLSMRLIVKWSPRKMNQMYLHSLLWVWIVVPKPQVNHHWGRGRRKSTPKRCQLVYLSRRSTTGNLSTRVRALVKMMECRRMDNGSTSDRLLSQLIVHHRPFSIRLEPWLQPKREILWKTTHKGISILLRRKRVLNLWWPTFLWDKGMLQEERPLISVTRDLIRMQTPILLA